MEYPRQVERWGVFEASLPGKTEGNPFTDYTIEAEFVSRDETVRVRGFYDGDGIYRVRFMPSFEGDYTFTISGSFSAEEEQAGAFTAVAAGEGNRGPVRIRGFHFEYEDGTPYYPLGTTAYVWELQGEDVRRRTLEELAKGYFNKIRFCVFPKHYLYNLHDPISFPFEGTPCKIDQTDTELGFRMEVQPGNDWDFTRPNPAHFRNVEQAIRDLGALGVEADLIVMHPYDRWGFSHMTADQDDLYWRYVIARFSAFRNVWWSLANEYDILTDKTVSDWERYAQILLDEDPYHHPRSIHNCMTPYDHARPWITHCSVQRTDLYKSTEFTDDLRVRFGKPVIFDEVAYEGDIDQGWGNISGQELVRRFWEAALRGGYATHGETFDKPDGVLWWSHGGTLYGESPARIRFLREILAQTPGIGLRRMPASWDELAATAEGIGDTGYYLYYYGFMRPCCRRFSFPEDVTLTAEIIDTWNMTITPAGTHKGSFVIELPRREYMAIRLRRVEA